MFHISHDAKMRNYDGTKKFQADLFQLGCTQRATNVTNERLGEFLRDAAGKQKNSPIFECHLLF
ncbi:uncharacterized protein PRCAT00004307001 [Priceomyces carsonii]|uniref:uncharacterized protein n=1 Tax=Priceomyces carsonii TaxID=28549 RepID=UPI002ED9E845|nr:unnamed protein product [Priceomyces carsonii]